MKRILKFTYIFTFLFVALFMISCSGNQEKKKNYTPLTTVENPVVVNFIGHWLGEGEREDFVRNIVREYEFKNQEVKINLKFPEEIYYDKSNRKSNEEYTSKVVTEGLTDWDIIRINGEYREVYELLKDPNWAKKYFVDFSKIPEFVENTRPELIEETKKEWNGVIPGPLLEGQYWAMWCNNKVAQKIGIEVKQYGMTFDDFIGYIEAVNKYNDFHPDDLITPLYEAGSWETTQLLAFCLYSSLLDSSEEFLSRKITERRLQAWQKTLEAMEILATYKPINPDWRNVDWASTEKDFLDEKYLFYINGSWMYNIWNGIDRKLTLNVMPTEFPGFNSLVIYPSGYLITWGVLKNAPHKKEAIDFILAMNKPDIAEAWSRYTKCPTGIKGNLVSSSFGGDQFENYSNYIQKNYGSNIYRYYVSGEWVLNANTVNDNIYYREVIEGKMTAKEAMRKIRQRIGR